MSEPGGGARKSERQYWGTLAPVWEFADSLCLVAPISAPPDRSLGYMASVAQTFYM